jgi:outer membrane murein-binding lipoprotein Lpp
MRLWRTVLLGTLMVAGAAGAQTADRMTTGVQTEERVPSGAAQLDNLTQAERLELLRMSEAERRRGRRGIDVDCRPEQARKAMTDLEQASWRLKCRK